MIRFLATGLLVLFATSVSAEMLPAYYNVTGVASNDALNIRNAPDANAEISGAIGHNATGIEVVSLSDDGKWAQIGMEESSGWVAFRFLKRADGQDAPLTARGTYCFGTEPFWSAEITPGGMFSLSEMDGGDTTGPLAQAPSANRTDKEGFIARMGDGTLQTGILSHEVCSDGMSDRVFGATLDLIISGPAGDKTYSGCCSLH